MNSRVEYTMYIPKSITAIEDILSNIEIILSYVLSESISSSLDNCLLIKLYTGEYIIDVILFWSTKLCIFSNILYCIHI